MEKPKLIFAAKALHVPCLICQSWKWYLRCLCLNICFHVINALNFLSWVLNHCMMFTNEKSHIKKWTHGSMALTWHEIACRCLWWPCDENLWPCMKFVSYMLYVLFLLIIRSHAHEREIFVKNASFSSWLCHLLRCPFVSCWRCLCSNCGYLTCLCLNFSMCSALCIFEKHMLVFLELIHALPTRGRKVSNSCFQGSVHRGKKNWEKCICSGGACIHAFGSSFLLMVWSPFCLSLRSQQFWSILSWLCWAIALALRDHDLSLSSDLFLDFVCLLITCLSFSFTYFLFLFSLNWLLVCVLNAFIKGEIEDRSV
jgi:hypothetical protein